MNRYAFLCRLTGPAMLLLTGVLALLNEANILSWGRSWPLYLITWGVLRLIQRAALSQTEVGAYPGYYPPPVPAAAAPSTSIIPTPETKPADPEWRP